MRGAKGQQWSLEVILALSVFIVVFVFILTFLTFTPQQSTRALELQSVALFDEIRSERGFLQGSTLDWNKFTALAQEMESDEFRQDMKRRLGISGQFCIFIEINDQEVVPVPMSMNDGSGSSGVVYGIGDNSILFLDEDCECTSPQDCQNCYRPCSQIVPSSNG